MIGKRYFFLLIFLFVQCFLFGKNETSASKENMQVNPTNLIYQSAELLGQMKLSEAKELIDSGLNLCSKQQNIVAWTRLQYLLSDYYYYNQEYDQALGNYIKVMPYLLASGDSSLYLCSKNTIGLLYSFENLNEKALTEFLDIINFVDELDYTSIDMLPEKLNAIINMMSLSNLPNIHELVFDYAPEAITLATQLNDSVNLATIYNILGTSYKFGEKFSDALKNYKQANSIFSELGDNYHNAHVLNNMGALYDYYGLFDSAIYFYDMSLSEFERVGYMRGVAVSKLGIASVFANTYRFDEARESIYTVVDISKEYRFNNILLSAYEELVKIEEFNKNYQQAFVYSNKHYDLKDSILALQNQEKLNKLLSDIEVIQKENEIQFLKAEKAKNRLLLNKNIREKQVAVTTAILLIIIVYIIVLLFRQKSKTNKILLSKNSKIEEQNHKLINMNAQIRAINKKLEQSRHDLVLSNNSKNRFFSILAHDLRSPLHNISGLSFLLHTRFNALNDDEKIGYASDIYSSCVQLNNLLENLLEWSRAQTNNILFSPKMIEPEKVVASAVHALLPVAGKKQIIINNTFDVKTKVYADSYMLETIFRNIINNGIKFTPVGGSVTITAGVLDSVFRISVADTGIGIKKDVLKHIFDVDSQSTQRGTQNEKGTGLGLVICKEFVDYHQGKIWVETEPGNGSVFHIDLPFDFRSKNQA